MQSEAKMTRAKFVAAYAERSGLTAEYAVLGILDIAGRVQVALPCACGDDSCEGWAMVSVENVNSHLELYAPEPIASAIRKLSEGRPLSDGDKPE